MQDLTANTNASVFSDSNGDSEQQSSSGSQLIAPALTVTGIAGQPGVRKKFVPDSSVGKSSVDKLLYPKMTGRSDIAPYRIVLGHVREKVFSFFRFFG